jgi:putative oxidoreductase
VAVSENVVLSRPRPGAAVQGRWSWLEEINPGLDRWGPLAARLGVGTVLFMHGIQKLGLFGGAGWAGTIDFFAQKLHIPPPLGALVIVTEVVGGACLLLGFFARPAALAVAIEMIVAAYMVHLPNGFFLNFSMTPGRGHGIEMNLALLALACVVLIEGGGRFALDTVFARALGLNEAAGPAGGSPPRAP